MDIAIFHTRKYTYIYLQIYYFTAYRYLFLCEQYFSFMWTILYFNVVNNFLRAHLFFSLFVSIVKYSKRVYCKKNAFMELDYNLFNILEFKNVNKFLEVCTIRL